MTHTQQNSGSGLYFVTGFLVGGLAAAATTLLIAPQSGKETREQLLQTSIDLGNEVVENADKAVAQVRKNGHKLTSEVQDTVNSLKRRGQDLFEEQRGHLAAAIAGEK